MQADLEEGWQVSPEAAIRRQSILGEFVRQEPLGKWQTAGGLAFGFSRDGQRCWAAGVVADRQGDYFRQVTAAAPVALSYTPGLLAYAVGPAVQQVLNQIDKPPDVLLCLGHGIAHPRRCGLACQIGLIYNLPTVGCAQRLLVGEHKPVGPEPGAWELVTDSEEVIGAGLRTQSGVEPIIVSVGHNLDLPGAIEVVMSLVGNYRWPEPLRRARQLVRQARAASEDK